MGNIGNISNTLHFWDMVSISLKKKRKAAPKGLFRTIFNFGYINFQSQLISLVVII